MSGCTNPTYALYLSLLYSMGTHRNEEHTSQRLIQIPVVPQRTSGVMPHPILLSFTVTQYVVPGLKAADLLGCVIDLLYFF